MDIETKEKIKALALKCGFKLKPQPSGGNDLHQYVYDFAESIRFSASVAVLTHLLSHDKHISFLKKISKLIASGGEIVGVTGVVMMKGDGSQETIDRGQHELLSDIETYLEDNMLNTCSTGRELWLRIGEVVKTK